MLSRSDLLLLQSHILLGQGGCKDFTTHYEHVEGLLVRKDVHFLARRLCLVYGGKIVPPYRDFTTLFLGLSILCTFGALKGLPSCNRNVFKMTMDILQSGSIHTVSSTKAHLTTYKLQQISMGSLPLNLLVQCDDDSHQPQETKRFVGGNWWLLFKMFLQMLLSIADREWH